MRNIIQILFFSFIILGFAFAQVGVGVYVGLMNAVRHGGSNSTYIFKYPPYILPPLNPLALGNKWFTLNSMYPTTPVNFRSMYGTGAFMQNTDLTSQKAQKFMQFRNFYYCTANANTLRIAWRYNAHNDNLYEVGLYSHKNHTNDFFICGGPKINSREIAFTTIRLKKNSFFRYQLIFGKAKSAVRIWYKGQDETIMIWRKSSNSTWPYNISFTDAEASIYFANDPNTVTNRTFMTVFSSAFTVPIYIEPTYYHVNLFLFNCLFSKNDNPEIRAKNKIVYPVKNLVGPNHYQNTFPNPIYAPPYCVIESGSKVLFRANSYIELNEGLYVEKGGVFSVGQ
jgi:hypothetical protein